MVETRSKKSAASRDVAAIQQSVPSVRDVVMPKRGKADGSRPTSAASSAKSMPTTVSAGHTTESFPLATPSPSATPRRTREGGRGTRSTPSTPPSHRRLLPRSQRSPREAPGSGGHGDDADGDAASAERSIDSHVTQFAESLRALRELGLAGIRDFGDEGFREASEEQESEQMRVLLEERSRARDLVRQLERDKQLQAEALRLMESRIVEQEMTEEELVAAEREVTRARLESAAMATAKEALEHELARQMDQNARWSEKLRAAESEEAALLATAEKAERALAEKEAEAEALAHKLTAAERELDQLRAADVDRALRAAGAGSSADEDDRETTTRNEDVRRFASSSSLQKNVVSVPKKLVASDATPTPGGRARGAKRTNAKASGRGGGARRGGRRSAFFGAVSAAVAAAVAAAALQASGGFLPAARVVAAASARVGATFAAPKDVLLSALFSGDGDHGPNRNASAAPNAAAPAAPAAFDAETPPWLWFEADSRSLRGDESRSVDRREGPVSDVAPPGFPEPRDAPAAAAAGLEPETVSDAPLDAISDTHRSMPPSSDAAVSAAAEEKQTKKEKKRAPSTPLLAATALGARAAEEAAWEEAVARGWAAWRRLGGSDRRARVKTAARRAESAAFVAKEAREASAEAARRYDALLAEIEATRDSEEAAAAAARQRLTLASHEVDAETAGSERKWESLREKAVQATRALETELRALG